MKKVLLHVGGLYFVLPAHVAIQFLSTAQEVEKEYNSDYSASTYHRPRRRSEIEVNNFDEEILPAKERA